MRVLHLPIVICNQPWEMSRALRKINIESDYMILDDNDASWLMPGRPDYNLSIDHRQSGKEQKRIARDIKRFFRRALLKYDVFHYHSNISLFEDFWDLKVLKFFRKKIVVSYWGCDIRSKSINLKYKYNTCEVCPIGCSDDEKNRRKQMFDQYADIKIAHMPELLEYAPKQTIFLPSFINTSFWSPSKDLKKENKIFKIFHAFGNSQVRGDVKGTDSIKGAVENLKKEGYNIGLIFFDKVPNTQLKPLYEQADLVIEQLKYGTYGLTALEAMALEKPVVGYIRSKYQKYYSDKIPIINASPDNITDVLRRIIRQKNFLSEIGKKSRQFVCKYHDSKILAQKLYQLYKSLYF